MLPKPCKMLNSWNFQVFYKKLHNFHIIISEFFCAQDFDPKHLGLYPRNPNFYFWAELAVFLFSGIFHLAKVSAKNENNQFSGKELFKKNFQVFIGQNPLKHLIGLDFTWVNRIFIFAWPLSKSIMKIL